MMCAGTTPELSPLQLCRIHIASLELRINQSLRLDDEQQRGVDGIHILDQPVDGVYWADRRGRIGYIGRNLREKLRVQLGLWRDDLGKIEALPPEQRDSRTDTILSQIKEYMRQHSL
ncbi:hypothetical protein HYU72_00595 [Candidatus Berkelbacteria bacterium]|nr:hypothetical protein [Candidatus Berkelbacteria bacterium]